MSLKSVFQLNSQLCGLGPVSHVWQKAAVSTDGFTSVGQYLATAGSNHIVCIVDRHGNLIDKMHLPGDCTGLDWSNDGELLAAIQDKTGHIFLWDAPSRSAQTPIDTNLKGLSYLKWSSATDQLAVGTTKGNLLIYNRRSQKRIPVLGKHSKSILAGSWHTNSALLALGSDDKTFSISNEEGDTLIQTVFKGIPEQFEFIELQNAKGNDFTLFVSCIIGKHILYIRSIHDTSAPPIELTFQARYGEIVGYAWLNEKSCVIAFSHGYIITMTSEVEHFGEEMTQYRCYKDYLSHFAYSASTGKIAVCGDNCLKIMDANDLNVYHNVQMGSLIKEVNGVIQLEENLRGQVHQLYWSPDSIFLSLTTKSGAVLVFLAQLPPLGQSYGSRLGYLTNLNEVIVVDYNLLQSSTIDELEKSKAAQKIQAVKEPNLLALGPSHIAIGEGSKVRIHSIVESSEVIEKDFSNVPNAIALNEEFIAILNGGLVYIHSIDRVGTKHKPNIFEVEGSVTTSLNLHTLMITSDFCITMNSQGSIFYFSLESWSFVHEFRHILGIQKAFANQKGTKILLFDNKNVSSLYNPLDDSLIRLPEIKGKLNSVVWNGQNNDIFIIHQGDSLYVMSILHDSIQGLRIISLGSDIIPKSWYPLAISNQDLLCLLPNGRISSLKITAFQDDVNKIFDLAVEKQHEWMLNLYSVGKLSTLFSLLDKRKHDLHSGWGKVAQEALRLLDLKVAKRIYRYLGDIFMVQAIEEIEVIEDKSLISGHIAALLGEYSIAQEFFLKSSRPLAALELRLDLMQWEPALALAQRLDPQSVGAISHELAQQYESKGRYQDAIVTYEQALNSSSNGAFIKHLSNSRAGLIRCFLRTGEIAKSLKLLQEIQDTSLLCDCAEILDGLKMFAEAATLFERGGKYEKAVESYLKVKNFGKIGPLLASVKNPRLHLQYARAKEAEGNYVEAIKAYEFANDAENIARIYLEHLKDPESAVSIVRKTKSQQGARLVSKFFEKLGDYKSVVEFCFMARLKEDAFNWAQAHNQMEYYASLLGEDATIEELESICAYFANRKDYYLAGYYAIQVQQYVKAIKYLMQCPSDNGKALDLAIEAVGLAKNNSMTHMLIDHLMGETDGQPKEAKYIFKLYMSLGQYREATRTAVIIAREEQTLGNYRVAHDLLVDCYRQLRAKDIRIPAAMEHVLTLLHSYILVKIHIKSDQHEKAARMLLRVSSHISKFPAHSVPILTSAVVECQREGMKKSAFDVAAILMRPEYRSQIDPKYKRKVEAIVRRPETEEPEEPRTACPYCMKRVQVSALDCPECTNRLPMCIASGYHLDSDTQWCECPMCHFASHLSDLDKHLAQTQSCPMCNGTLNGVEGQVEASNNTVLARIIKDKSTWLHANELDKRDENAPLDQRNSGTENGNPSASMDSMRGTSLSSMRSNQSGSEAKGSGSWGTIATNVEENTISRHPTRGIETSMERDQRNVSFAH